jgi:hypothetical protein
MGFYLLPFLDFSGGHPEMEYVYIIYLFISMGAEISLQILYNHKA